MKVLGRELVRPFDAFWNLYSPQIGISAQLIEKGHPAVFGAENHREGSNGLPRWMELPDDALSYHVAHELTHQIIRRQGYPGSVRGQQYMKDSPEARVGGDLEEMVSHHVLEEILSSLPFDRAHIQQHLFASARRGLEESPIPEYGTFWWATWACRFCELQHLLPRKMWIRLEVVYDGRCPEIASKGRELADIMRVEGYKSPDQALQAMIKIRDTLGLKLQDRCLVFDPRHGTMY